MTLQKMSKRFGEFTGQIVHNLNSRWPLIESSAIIASMNDVNLMTKLSCDCKNVAGARLNFEGFQA